MKTSQMLISGADIYNFALFVERLLDDEYPPSLVLQKHLGDELSARLGTAKQRDHYDEKLKSALVTALNGVLSEAEPFDETTFFAVTTQEANLNPNCLNRRLLSEAYPLCVQVEYSRKESPNQWFRFYFLKSQQILSELNQNIEKFKDGLEVLASDISINRIVQARAKTLKSLTEKIWRKEKYLNPLAQITDLVGGRVILDTQQEIVAMTQKIRDNYTVDEQNSEDTQQRLAYTEFGYKGMHLIVNFTVPHSSIAYGVKAEIQIKTMLEHAWSTIVHDRMYKSDHEAPTSIKRSLHRVAALLEEADSAFAQTVKLIDEYRPSYGAYMTQKQLEKELETQRAVLECLSDSPSAKSVRLEIARLLKAEWRWQEVVEVLRPIVDRDPTDYVNMAEYGHAICRANRKQPSSKEYGKGLKILEKVKATTTGKLKAPTSRYLGWAYSNTAFSGDFTAFKPSHDNYEECCQLDPTDPYAMAACIGTDHASSLNTSAFSYLHPVINQMIERCKGHIRSGVELPWAYFTIGRFQLMLGAKQSHGQKRDYETLDSYCKGIHHCLNSDCRLPEDVLLDEQNFLGILNIGREMPVAHQWIDYLLLIALYLKNKDEVWLDKLKEKAKHYYTDNRPVVILAGDSSSEYDQNLSIYSEYLQEAFDGYDGHIISGGTTTGISAEAAKIVRAQKDDASSTGSIDLYGYVPGKLPQATVLEEERHINIIRTSGKDFSPLEPIQYWIDILASGIDPQSVKIVGVGGGAISEFEYRLGVSLGARVALFAESGRAANQMLNDEYWSASKDLFSLSNYPISLRVFLNMRNTQNDTLSERDEEFLEKLAEATHVKYLESGMRDKIRKAFPASVPWQELEQGYKTSNYSQAECMVFILASCGYSISDDKSVHAVATFPSEDLEMMAELEHARWCIERQSEGWRYSPNRNDENKLHNDLVPWGSLPDSVKVYDYDAVRAWPKILESTGRYITRTRES